MQAQTIPRTLAAGLVVLAVALVLLFARTPNDELAVTVPDVTATPQPEVEVTIAHADAEPPAPSQPETSAAAKVRELGAMSETFRNSTFLIAIRDAGFICNELLRVYGGLDDSGKWTATCSEMLAYTVSVSGSGALRVDPMLQYFDGVRWPVRIEQGSDPMQIPGGRALRDSLPPETR
jgi:hypothetical protein